MTPGFEWSSQWPEHLLAALEVEPCVLVTLNLILGSAPRESGSRMIVTMGRTQGSIGGGNLEFTAIETARGLLQESAAQRQSHQPFGLGPALNQCCGGAVTVHFEVFSAICPEWLRRLTRPATGRRCLPRPSIVKPSISCSVKAPTGEHRLQL
jgi:xanthine dehydrogenase accessory factor